MTEVLVPIAPRRDRWRRHHLLVGLLMLLRAPSHSAQAREPDAGRIVTLRLAGVTDGRSCPCSYLDGTPIPRDRQLYVAGIGVRWPLGAALGGRFELLYAAELLPLVVSRGTANEDFRIEACADDGGCAYLDSPYPWTTTSLGAGVLPVGLVGRMRVIRTLHLQLRAAGGAVRLTRPVPFLEGRRLNFIGELAAMAEVRIGRSKTLTAGVTFNHISNGGTALVNPGMDSRMIELGLVLLR